jgi:hypothetical protein
MFSVYGAKCLLRKAVHDWVQKRRKGIAYDEDLETEVRKWLRQQSDLYVAVVNVLYYLYLILSLFNNAFPIS